MKGFVIALSSAGLIVMLVLLVLSLRNAQLSTERALVEPLPLIYAAFLLDDIGYEFNSIVGPQLVRNDTNSTRTITVTDQIQSYNYSSEISAYEAFLIGEVAGRTASNISTNFTNLTNGTITLFIDDGYVYTNNHVAREIVFTSSGGTNASSYTIYYTITAVRAGVTHMLFDSNGTMNISIHYTDLNGTAVEEGAIFPNQQNTFKVDYAGGSSMTVTLGQVNGSSGSLSMKTTNISADIVWSVFLPPLAAAQKRGYEYAALISYTQGPVNIVRRIGK